MRARANLGSDTRLITEAIRTEDLVGGGVRQGGQVGFERRLLEWLDAELGYRYTDEETAASDETVGVTPLQTNSLRARLTARPAVAGVPSLYAEYEQDLATRDKRRVLVGGDVRLLSRARLYARHELISSFAGAYALNPAQERSSTVVGVAADYSDRTQLFSEYRVRDAMSGREAQAAVGLRNEWALGEGVRAQTSFERLAPLGGDGTKTLSLTGALEFTGNPLWKGSTRLEYRAADSGDQVLGTLGFARKVSRDFTFLGQSAASVQTGGGPAYERTRLGMAYRSTDDSRWNALGAYEHRWERRPDAEAGGDATHQAHILTGHANVQVTDELNVRGQLAGKLANDTDAFGSTVSQSAWLLGARAVKDVTDRIDVGALTRLLNSEGSRTFGLGFELGFLARENLRVALGYNLFGFRDRDLAATEYTDHGLYIDVGFKFDERLFGLGAQAGGRQP